MRSVKKSDQNSRLFIGIWWTCINVAKAKNEHAIPALNFILQAIGITGFIYLAWFINEITKSFLMSI